MKKIISILFLSLGIQMATANSFNASYNASYKGYKGTAKLTFSQEGETYKAKLALKPGSLLSLAISSIVDSVEGTFEDGNFKPKHYVRIKNGKYTMLKVNFFGNEVTTINKKGKEKSFSISDNGQDPLSQIVQIRYDLKNNQLKKEYHLVTDSSERTYSATRSNQQITLIESNTKKPRRFVLSFNESGDALVQMEKFKKGKSQLFIKKKKD